MLAKGSPPPTRGTRDPYFVDRTYEGITPAYAGNTNKLIALISVIGGSPPPTRGTLSVQCLRDREPGITPAYAGNTFEEGYYPKDGKDHPRLRGEHFASRTNHI